MSATSMHEAPPRRAAGFTLVEMMVTVAIVGILAAIAIPSYSNYMVRSSRSAAQSELLDIAAAQERIFMNSGAYTSSVTGAYTGLSTGGLGIASGQTKDGRYTLTVTLSGTAFYTLTAAPVAGSSQAGDGNISMTSAGTRLWNSKPW
jgi:type IV pilus assembly protein PilE